MNTLRLSRIVGAAVFVSALGLALCAQAGDKETLLYNFRKSAGGVYPAGALVMDSTGNLYGAANQGGISSCGSYGCGTIFALSPNSSGGWTYTVIHKFNGVQHDSLPIGPLVMDAAGNLYGATQGYASGEIFELSPDGSGGWSETVLYVFGGSNGIGSSPVVFDDEGNLYGASIYGGPNSLGFVFELSPGSGGWTLRHVHDFSGPDGSFPSAGVILDASGNIYGTTFYGGTSANCPPYGCGVVFELQKGAGTWTEKVLRDFDGNNGSSPGAPLMMDAAGHLYGTTTGGGPNGFGIVFEMRLISGTWQATTLHSFTDGNGDGAFPSTALVMDAAGNLYGTTFAGGGGLGNCVVVGDKGCGEVFELSPAGGGWKHIILHDFTGGKDGAIPEGVILDGQGNLFGTTESGGSRSYGAVFELSPPGSK